MNRAVFLDRDGTIIRESEYLSDIEGLALLPGAAAGIKRLRAAGFLIIVVSNQSGVARGMFDADTVEMINAELGARLAAMGAPVDGFFYCPHHPEHTGECQCRKPLPGMLLEAAEKHGVDLDVSWMVGDKLSDVEAGAGAGCHTALVLTGYGMDESFKAAARGVDPDLVAEDLADFADLIVGARENNS